MQPCMKRLAQHFAKRCNVNFVVKCFRCYGSYVTSRLVRLKFKCLEVIVRAL